MDWEPRRNRSGDAPAASSEAKPLAHMLAAQAPVVAAMRVDHQPSRRGSREPHREAAIPRAMAGAWRKHLIAAHLAAERTGYVTQVHGSAAMSNKAFTSRRRLRRVSQPLIQIV